VSTAPQAYSEASVNTSNGLSNCGIANTGGETKHFLSVLKAVSSVAVNGWCHAFLEVRLVSGLAISL
jgi:hypothetical protein